MEIISPQNWQDYELIDSGNFYKLERFGEIILSRPEPQALWRKNLSENEWKNLPHASFIKDSNSNSEKGNWLINKKMPQEWFIKYNLQEHKLSFRLALTAFKHIGIFPEQAANWEYIFSAVKNLPNNAQILNLFAYTGGASLAAAAANSEVSVTHLDAVKQVVSWSRQNMENSGLKNIRWIVDDALKFLRREVRREKKYHAIFLDPPAYGRGPNGEKWILQENIDELLSLCSQILLHENSFVLLNLYSMGFSPLIAENLALQHFPNHKTRIGELFVADKANRRLPLGTFAKIENFLKNP